MYNTDCTPTLNFTKIRKVMCNHLTLTSYPGSFPCCLVAKGIVTIQGMLPNRYVRNLDACAQMRAYFFTLSLL